ncbi:MAG: hypothetical protein H8E41_04710 [Desulfobulbaceae bacterium]|uniref:Uncharacterized protein n=1 Tax=Candidatus Desulfobia pelagia TaxID=2841692 RepID=A0A8J6NDZ8_9BACT|nr:hypothetical protein [Candidatus Desulfobia pelagia]
MTKSHRGHELQSAIRNPQSAIRNPQSAIRNPQSAIRNPQWHNVLYFPFNFKLFPFLSYENNTGSLDVSHIICA